MSTINNIKIGYLSDHIEFAQQYANWNITEWPDYCAEFGLSTIEEFHADLLRNNLPTINLPFSIVMFINNDNNKFLIGAGSLTFEDSPILKNFYPWIASIYVDKQYRGNGYARKIIQRLEFEAFERFKFQKIYLWCKPELEKFYHKLGWTTFNIGQFKNNSIIHMFKECKV